MSKDFIDNIQSNAKKISKKVVNYSKPVIEKILKIAKAKLPKNLKNLKFGGIEIKFAKDGMNTIYVVASIVVISILLTGFGFLTALLLSFLGITMFFFRDPERVLPDRKNVVVSPCDGKILKIETANLPEELNSNDAGEYTKISVFMNLTDMHVQRIPVDGEIKQVEYVSGLFLNASLDKASKDNERNYVLIKAKNGDSVCITQIAGLIARRIVCNVRKDEICSIGERYGMIKFGSRIELYVPKNYKIEVLPGQRVVCGETVMASWK